MTGHPLRKDAAANRQRLLDAASELFAEHGLEVTLNAIAHRAGVGVGTAYRRFANKEAVIDALFEARLQAVAALAAEGLAAPDAWQGLVTFLDRAMEMRRCDRGLEQIMDNPALGDARVGEARDRIAPILAAMVARAKTQGAVRDDLDQSDLIFMQVALSGIIEASNEIAPELYRRYLTFLLDGIRAGGPRFTPLPTVALTAEETHLAMTRARRGRRVGTAERADGVRPPAR